MIDQYNYFIYLKKEDHYSFFYRSFLFFYINNCNYCYKFI